MRARPAILALLLLLPALLFAQVDRNVPSVGYVFPAGASRGDTAYVYVGGQKFFNIKGAHLTGEGVALNFIKRYPPMRNLNGDQRKVLNYKLAMRTAELSGKPANKKAVQAYEKMGEAERKRGMNLNHPIFEGIEKMDTQGIRVVRDFVAKLNKRQFTAAIADTVMFEVKVAEDAPLGERELRIETSRGLSNPLRFQISQAIELKEREPNGPKPGEAADPFELDAPIVWNGQIMPGDVDRFRIKAAEGERITFEVLARRLIPYIADAVPGWFQPTLSLLDEQGNQLAFADDHLGSPDPVLEFTAPREAEYTLEIRDAIYRGREDFVYRVFASHKRLEENAVRHSDVSYEPSELPFGYEREPNSSMQDARLLQASASVAGAIDTPGDSDWIAFDATAGSQIVAEIEARRFDSPLDSILRLIDSRGKMLAYNDDYMLKRGHVHTGPGLQTHHADSYLTAEIPEDGRYYLVVEDAQHNGSEAHQYRLRLAQPEPQYEVRAEPSAINIGPTACAAVHVWVNRKDGFDGPVDIVAADPSAGIRVEGGRVPAGVDDVWLTLRAVKPQKGRNQTIQLMAKAEIEGETVAKPVVPTDNCMQAFLWRHLVPAQELRTFEWAGYRRLALPEVHTVPALKIARGSEASLEIPIHELKQSQGFSYKIGAGPKGLKLDSSNYADGRLTLDFSSDAEVDAPVTQGNLIIEVYYTQPPSPKKPKAKAKSQMLGVLPSIPFQIIES